MYSEQPVSPASQRRSQLMLLAAGEFNQNLKLKTSKLCQARENHVTRVEMLESQSKIRVFALVG